MTSPSEPQSLAEVPPRSLPWVFRILAGLNSLFGRFSRKGTINPSVMKLLDLRVAASPNPVDGISSRDIIYDEESKQILRIFTPSSELQALESKKRLPLVIFFHGGGFSILDAGAKVYDSMTRRLVKDCEAVVVSVNYHATPEFRYPTQYEECFQALRWVQADFANGAAGELSSIADPSRCFLAGDSAGGNIAHFMMVRVSQNDLSPLRIRGVAMISPFFGGAQRTPYELRVPNPPFLDLKSTDWFWASFLPEGSDRDHPACNVFGPQAEDISGLSLPPVWLTIGSEDILQDWQVRYVEKMRKMGKQVKVKYTNLCHAEWALPEPMKNTTHDTAQFIRSLYDEVPTS